VDFGRPAAVGGPSHHTDLGRRPSRRLVFGLCRRQVDSERGVCCRNHARNAVAFPRTRNTDHSCTLADRRYRSTSDFCPFRIVPSTRRHTAAVYGCAPTPCFRLDQPTGRRDNYCRRFVVVASAGRSLSAVPRTAQYCPTRSRVFRRFRPVSNRSAMGPPGGRVALPCRRVSATDSKRYGRRLLDGFVSTAHNSTRRIAIACLPCVRAIREAQRPFPPSPSFPLFPPSPSPRPPFYFPFLVPSPHLGREY